MRGRLHTEFGRFLGNRVELVLQQNRSDEIGRSRVPRAGHVVEFVSQLNIPTEAPPAEPKRA